MLQQQVHRICNEPEHAGDVIKVSNGSALFKERNILKKFITLIAAAAMLDVSCQMEAPETNNSSATDKLTATIVKTKVSYTETLKKDLQPAWEVGDEIIGFDDAGNTYTLTVASVEAETATLSADKEITDGAYHLIYKSGASAGDISFKTLAVGYNAQAGDKTMPAVMLADGIVTDGSCNFAFTNAGAIIGISAVNGVPSGSTISKITVEGANLSAATVALSGSALALTATPAATDAISTSVLSGITTTDANGTLSTPVFIAVPDGAVIAKISVAIQAREPGTMTIPSTAADKKNIDYVEIEARYDGTNLSTKKWAKWNVGANNQADYGWYFSWAGTEGYVYNNGQWVSAIGDETYSYTLTNVTTAGPSEYLYVHVNMQSSAPTSHDFNWVNTPYQTQNTTSSLKFTKYLGSTSSTYKDPSATDADALKTVLDPEDDAARVNWGGTWRMPTKEEFQALYDVTHWAWDATDEGWYVFSPNASHTAGTWAPSIPGDLDKTDALLFFPAAGYGDGNNFNGEGSDSNYWSSTLAIDETTACYLWFNINEEDEHDIFINDYRRLGFPVRPVSDFNPGRGEYR